MATRQRGPRPKTGRLWPAPASGGKHRGQRQKPHGPGSPRATDTVFARPSPTAAISDRTDLPSGSAHTNPRTQRPSGGGHSRNAQGCARRAETYTIGSVRSMFGRAAFPPRGITAQGFLPPYFPDHCAHAAQPRQHLRHALAAGRSLWRRSYEPNSQASLPVGQACTPRKWEHSGGQATGRTPAARRNPEHATVPNGIRAQAQASRSIQTGT